MRLNGALLALCLCLMGPAAKAGDAASFLNEVIPLLTRQGCNQGACHGKGAGQNGFRLSLRGYAPELDHRWITREMDGRRLDPTQASSSLLLRKATAEAPHEGGRLFGRDSREYRLLEAWLQAGAPGPQPGELQAIALELTPTSLVLKPGESMQMTAWARFPDGSRRDVTWLTRFDANDAAVATVTPSGQIQAQRAGASAVRAMFQTEVAVVTIAVPANHSVDPDRYNGATHPVDRFVLDHLRTLNIEPSDRCTDDEFIRRLFLDTCGVLPSAEDVQRFAKDTSPDKRTQLIDHVLQRPEFNEYWALLMGDLLQNRKERDHDVRGVKGVRQFHDWIRKEIAKNTPWDQLARAVLLASGPTTEQPAVGYYIVTVGEHRHAENSEVAESVAQAFLGTRIGCARCHNHPLERYTQDDFYHFAAYFSRVKLDRKDPKLGPTHLRVSHPDPNRNKDAVGVVQPRTGQFLPPRPLDRTQTPIAPEQDPRIPLVNWITQPDNPYFAGAMVNRIWHHYLGVGLVEPIDDLRVTNPPTIPALWEHLKTEFVSTQFDLRHLMREILTSETYQRSSATRPSNTNDTRNYSHYYARRLQAEVLHDAINHATGTTAHFPGYPQGTRAVQVPDPATGPRFLTLFGRSERVTACACERNGDITMPQLLHLQNSESLQHKITHGWLARRLSELQDDDQLLDEVMFRCLSRPTRPSERQAIKQMLARGEPRDEVFRDLFWAVLNSKDFAFNH